MSALRSLDLFSGMGGITHGLRGLGIEPVAYCEYAPGPQTLLKNLMAARAIPKAPIEPDVRQIHDEKYKGIDVCCAGFPCFPAGTLVNTARGYVPIEDVETTDLLLGHSGQFRSIVNRQRKVYEGPMYTITAEHRAGRPITCTPEHPFYTRTLDDPTPTWTDACKLTTDQFVGLPIDQRAIVPLIGGDPMTAERCWALGYVMADARLRGGPTDGRSVLVWHAADKDAVISRLAEVALAKLRYDADDHCSMDLDAAWLKHAWTDFQGGAVLPDWVLAAPKHLGEAFVDGFVSMFGGVRGQMWAMFVIDPRAALGLQRLLHKLGYSASVHNSVEGAVVYHYVSVRTDATLFVDNGYTWHRVLQVEAEECNKQVVYNFEVETDNSYAAENIMTHNCIGFSSCGKREGYDNAQSGLFSEVVRLVKAIKPKFVFLENVRPIATYNNAHGVKVVVKKLAPLGYELRWVVVSAADVGAPQMRNRWFCLCVRNDVAAARFQLTQTPVKPFSWSKEPGVRMKPALTSTERAFNAACGNGVVPDAVRLAFILAFEGFSEASADPRKLFAKRTLTLQPVKAVAHTGDNYGKACVARKAKIYDAATQPSFPLEAQSKIELVVDPTLFKPKRGTELQIKLPKLKKPQKFSLWPTPRAGNAVHGSNAPTERNVRDVGTMIRFEKSTKHEERGGLVAPEFLGWLMGYSGAWVKAATRA